MRGLYLLTPDIADPARLVAMLEDALRPRVAVLVQFRNKTAMRRELAPRVAAVCAAHRVPMIVNDDVALARECGAAGVHLGEHDGSIAGARRTLGADAIIGASCYDDALRADDAERQGASYVAFGAFFPSSTKPNARRASTDLLRTPRGVPKVAIGGITADNARPLIDAGADLLAVVSDVFDAPDIAAAVRRYATLFQD